MKIDELKSHEQELLDKNQRLQLQLVTDMV